MSKKPKTLLFSLTAKDFEFQTFCTGGKGGQHRNAKQNGVRVIHPASGAVAEHRDGRDQRKNKEAAFAKIAETKAFKAWHKAEVARRLQTPSRSTQIVYPELRIIDTKVNQQMASENLKVEEYEAILGPKMS